MCSQDVVPLLRSVDPAQYLANLSCKFIGEEGFVQEIPSVQVLLRT
jgi:hypothetical protein